MARAVLRIIRYSGGRKSRPSRSRSSFVPPALAPEAREWIGGYHGALMGEAEHALDGWEIDLVGGNRRDARSNPMFSEHDGIAGCNRLHAPTVDEGVEGLDGRFPPPDCGGVGGYGLLVLRPDFQDAEAGLRGGVRLGRRRR